MAILLVGSSVQAAPERSAAAGESSQVKPSAERFITSDPSAKPARGARGTSSPAGTRPVVRGPRIPEEMRARMKAMLDKRIDGDLAQIKGLRGEALGLLTSFVKEAPRESREMPEALMRLGELMWEMDREGFLERFKAWETKPVDLRGPAPETSYEPSRAIFGRVLREYPWFEEYDLALYVDGFLATEQGKQEDALGRFERILRAPRPAA